MIAGAFFALFFVSRRSDNVSRLKNKSIRFLLDGIQADKKYKEGSLNSIKTLYKTITETDDPKKREEFLAEFKKRSLEFEDFLKNNPEVVFAEADRALLFAAVGGEYDEEEISFDSSGGKRVRKNRKHTSPDVSAIKELKKTFGSDDSAENKLVSAWIAAVTGGEEDG